MSDESDVKTVRELGGEFWAEAQQVEGLREHWKVIEQLTDLLVAVLARHAGKTIVNDADLPVTSLPRRFPRE